MTLRLKIYLLWFALMAFAWCCFSEGPPMPPARGPSFIYMGPAYTNAPFTFSLDVTNPVEISTNLVDWASLTPDRAEAYSENVVGYDLRPDATVFFRGPDVALARTP